MYGARFRFANFVMVLYSPQSRAEVCVNLYLYFDVFIANLPCKPQDELFKTPIF